MKNSGLFSREGPAVDRQLCPSCRFAGIFHSSHHHHNRLREANFRSQKRMVEIRAFLNPHVFPPHPGIFRATVGSVLEETMVEGTSYLFVREVWSMKTVIRSNEFQSRMRRFTRIPPRPIKEPVRIDYFAFCICSSRSR
jgi:hypothetical protein